MYGVNTATYGYVDVSNTLRGAKNYAARRGITKVYARPNLGYDTYLAAEKIGTRWRNK
jgi:hypothetical protein